MSINYRNNLAPPNQPGHPGQVQNVSGVPYPNSNIHVKSKPNPNATPGIGYTPNELNIPIHLYDKVPNLELYKKLQDAEKEIDLVMIRKELDFHVLHAKSLQPSNFKPEQGILRVFIYNTNENQPWQKQLNQQQGKPVDLNAESFWTLRVEGKFISDKELNYKFSSYLNGLSVDLIPNSDYPNLTENNGHIIEWRYGPMANEFDGMDIKRYGIFNLKCRIAIMVKNDGTKLKVSEKMSHFIGKTESTQQELIYAIWQYVLYKDLIIKKDINTVDAITSNTPGINEINNMPVDSGKDLTLIKADEILKDLLGVEQFKFTELYQLINQHFQPRDPIIIDYEINTKKSSTLGEVIIDIPVNLPLDLNKLQKEINEQNKAIFTEANSTISNIANLNSKIALGINQLNSLNYKQQFYEELSENPVEFIKNWTKTQLETLKSLKSDEGYDEEVVRRADFFKANEDVLKQEIDLLLASTHY